MLQLRSWILAFTLFGTVLPVKADQQEPLSRDQLFAIPSTQVTFQTGDSWYQDGKRMRLYGVQSCIRGTFYTDNLGQKQDCGAVSLAMFAALVRDTNPTCMAVAQISPTVADNQSTILVVCSAHIGDVTVDLGTAMIAEGFAFTAFKNDGNAVYVPYVVAEAKAREAGKGLWAFRDMPHPISTINSR